MEEIKEYKKVIEEIKKLNWKFFRPKEIIYLSLISAKEFADSLRVSLLLYPEHQNLHTLAQGEIETDNLDYEGYQCVGDHWEFLHHFCRKIQMTDSTSPKPLFLAGRNYLKYMKTLEPKHRAMTIFSREQELSGIFQKILDSHNWEQLGLGFFKYYLERHIELDSTEGGHGDLLEDLALDDNVLLEFYIQRLKLYKSLIF